MQVRLYIFVLIFMCHIMSINESSVFSLVGIQLWGGHGYIKDNLQEQVVRDARIASVWEGTTQIQGLDLLGRKILLNKLEPINSHCKGLYSKLFNVRHT